MPKAVNKPEQWEARRENWVARVKALVDQIERWSIAAGWQVQRGQKELHEDPIGAYQVPTLHIQRKDGELILNPIALFRVGGDGRVDLEALPTLSRVKLIGVDGRWQVVTDSNVPLRTAWDSDSFVRLADDLLS